MAYETSLTALADPTRRLIFETLIGAPQSVSALAERFPISRPAVSQHLKILFDAELVTLTRQGQRNIYGAEPEGLADLRRYLDQLWGDVMSGFAAEFETGDQK